MPIILIFLLFPSFCFSLQIVTDLNPVQMIVSELIFQTKHSVDLISKQESDVHDHEIGKSPSSLNILKNADLVVLANAAKYKKIKFNNLINLLEIVKIKSTNGKVDLHFWLDPENALIIANNVEEYLSKLDKKNSDLYAKNLERFKSDLMIKVKQIRCDLQNKDNYHAEYLVLHDAYRYFEEYFKIPRPVGSLYDSNHNVAKMQQINSYQNKIKNKDIKCIISNQMDSKLIKKFSNDIKITFADPLGIYKGNCNGYSYFDLLEATYNAHSTCIKAK